MLPSVVNSFYNVTCSSTDPSRVSIQQTTTLKPDKAHKHFLRKCCVVFLFLFSLIFSLPKKKKFTKILNTVIEINNNNNNNKFYKKKLSLKRYLSGLLFSIFLLLVWNSETLKGEKKKKILFFPCKTFHFGVLSLLQILSPVGNSDNLFFFLAYLKP